MSWNSISEEEAKQHKLYGLNGWLLLFVAISSIGVLFGFGSYFGMIELGAAEQELMFGINVETARNMMLLETLLSIPFIALAVMKHKLMPKVAISCMWLAFAVNLYTQMTLAATMQTVAIVVGAGIYGLLTWYFLASKRVNVTFAHRMPAGGQPVAAAAAY